jgi:sugar O-acyltransferase (sialic acid O-acetyltransferase NeuD family)
VKGLLIIGAGGHGKVVADTALTLGWSGLAFLDDRAPDMAAPLGVPVLGALRELSAHAGAFGHAIVAIGDANLRLTWGKRCREAGLEIVSLVHPTAAVSRFAQLGAGSVVFAQVAINADARLGEACIINTGATVDHDCVLGAGVHVCPGAHLAGDVRVGDGAWIGIGAAIRQGVRIGAHATVGAGAVVVADVSDSSTVVGVPARPRSAS